VSAVKTFKSLRLDRTSIICQVGGSFAAWCFWVKPKTLTLLRTQFIWQECQWTTPLNVRLL